MPPQNKGDLTSRLREALLNAQMQASFAQHRQDARDAAGREVMYYGGGDMSGARPTGSFWVSPGTPAADDYTAQVATLPVRDAETIARANAIRAGAFERIGKK